MWFDDWRPIYRIGICVDEIRGIEIAFAAIGDIAMGGFRFGVPSVVLVLIVRVWFKVGAVVV